MTDYLTMFLCFDAGVLIGMAITAFFIGSRGCYEGCLLQNPPKD